MTFAAVETFIENPRSLAVAAKKAPSFTVRGGKKVIARVRNITSSSQLWFEMSM